MSMPVDDFHEWLEPDGLGGFASGTICGVRTRRHHALLLTATQPPGGRVVLVNGFDAWVETPNGQYAISGQRYAPDVAYPDGPLHLEWFASEPWPQWRFRLADGTRVHQELFVCPEKRAVAIAWHLDEARPGVRLLLRPFLSGRDCGAVHVENADFNSGAEITGQRIVWRPYRGVPAVVSIANAAYASDPTWYRNFLYKEEQARGLDCTEDLASPGVLTWDLSAGEAAWVLTTDGADGIPADHVDAGALLDSWRRAERARRQFPSRLHRAADAYIVRRGSGKTIVAGYPWFLDCGRDTFIALRGLCLATGRLADARAILLAWAGTVDDGMVPSRFPENGEPALFNCVDGSLWFIIAVHELAATAAAQGTPLPPAEEAVLDAAVDAILTGYAAGTRHGIRCDADGLLAAGEPGSPLTWMDSMVGDSSVTPRIGKPVEVEALWLNALWVGSQPENKVSRITGPAG